MKCFVITKDRRCLEGWNIRTKHFDTLKECEKWARSVKNRLFNSYRVEMIKNGKISMCHHELDS